MRFCPDIFPAMSTLVMPRDVPARRWGQGLSRMPASSHLAVRGRVPAGDDHHGGHLQGPTALGFPQTTHARAGKRERERETDRQRERERDTERETERERETETETERKHRAQTKIMCVCLRT